MCWAIWHARNQLSFNKNDIPVDYVIALSQRTLKEFMEANKRPQEKSSFQRTQWSRPATNRIKLNTDAGSTKDGNWGFGMVCRDQDGEIIVAGNKICQAGIHIVEGEAQALLWGLQVAKNCSIRRLEVESDCSQLISALNHNLEYLNELGPILDEIKDTAMGFDEIRWSHLPRQANSLAHKIAADANVAEGMVWIEELPQQWIHIWNEDLINSVSSSS
ncbi:uncharacterized protein LOC126672858 [Mercurialis annua]|uniref:uncharacterized protein LOC126672858 n=1 Tax=Mercurialis annua TaxID=3986 RepID=UPI00215F04FF|nr:uncharacterized protein LOC126672858 [Mercurialis annua]